MSGIDLRSRVMLPAVLAALLASAPSAAAQALPAPSLDLDTLFAPPGGIAFTHFLPPNSISTTPEIPAAVAVDGDRIYTVGVTGSSSNRDVAIVARRTDGELDPGFSGDGKLPVSIGTEADFATGIAVLPDGRLRVVAATDVSGTGSENLDVAILGLNRDGSPDTTFGHLDGSGPTRTGRYVFAAGPGNDVPAGIEVGPQGRLAIVGGRSDGARDDVFVSLRLADGGPVTDFDGDGVRFTTTASVVDSAVDVAFRPGGGVVVLSAVDPTTAANDAKAVLHGFTDAGADDTRFFGGGDLALAVGDPDTVPGGLIVHRGLLWVAGSTRVGSDVDAFIARMEADGSDLRFRRFDMRGRLVASTQAVVSRAFDLAVVPGTPETLVAVGSADYAFAGTRIVDWGAAAFNDFDGDLASAGFGDIVLQAPGDGGLVAAAAGSQGWLAVAGRYIDSGSSRGEDFGNARLLVDAEKACDLAVTVAEPGEIVFRGSSPSALTARVQNVGTRACGGTLTVTGPYGMAPVATGVVAPGATFTAAAVPVTYHGLRRADDILLITLDAPADANTANNRAAAHVVFSFCDLAIQPVGRAGAIPTEGTRRFEVSLRNQGTAICRVRIGSKPSYPLARGTAASDAVAVAAPAGARPGTRVPVVLRAGATDDVDSGNNAVTVSPEVVRVGDSDVVSRGSRRFAGTARRGAGDLPAKRLTPARVDVAVLRAAGRRCSWLSSTRGTFTTEPRGRDGDCDARRWLRADGTTRWELELGKALARGRYVVYSRATIRAGFPEARFSARDRNRVEFTIR